MTPHFTRAEMQTSAMAHTLGLPNICPPELLANMQHVAEKLELVRAHFASPVRVLSCYRSPEVNKAVGGSKTSAHLRAAAADFIIPGVPVPEVARWCADNIVGFDQVIEEFVSADGSGGWVHMGFADQPRGQVLTAKKINGKTAYIKGLA